MHAVLAKFHDKVKEFEKESGWTVSFTKDPVIRPDNNTIEFSRVVIGTHSEEDRYRFEYKEQCHLLGLDPEWYGKAFTHFGKVYRVSGLLLTSRRYPVLAKNSRGTMYKFPAEAVRAYFEKVAASTKE